MNDVKNISSDSGHRSNLRVFCIVGLVPVRSRGYDMIVSSGHEYVYHRLYVQVPSNQSTFTPPYIRLMNAYAARNPIVPVANPYTMHANAL